MASTLAWKDLELQQRLGEGQAGVVWLATLRRPYKQFSEGTLIAVKRYRRWVLEIPGQYDRIYRELLAGMQMHHPNVVTTLGLLADTDGLPVLAMKYYSGQTLAEFLKFWRDERTLIDLPTAFRIIGEVASGLGALHAASLIHRDVKPSNIILCSDGAVVMDLGVVASKALAEQSQTNQFLGTIRYSAPEYLAGESCTSLVDAFSLGAIAYEIFEGREFYGEETHWACLIAARLGRYSSSIPESHGEHMHVSHIANLGGIHAAEAVRFIVRELLWDDPKLRLKDLAGLASHIAAGFWQRPFYVTKNNRIVGRRPAKVPSVRKFWDSTPKYTLGAAKDELLRILPSEHKPLFARIVAAAYWSSINLSPEQGLHAVEWRRLGLIEVDGGPEDFYPSDEELKLNACKYSINVGRTVKYLYRYGYLDDIIGAQL